MQPIEQMQRDEALLEISAQQKCTTAQHYAIFIAIALLQITNVVWFCGSGYQTALKQEPYFLSIFEFNGIYSIAYLPNVVLIFMSSRFILKIGVENALIICFFGIATTQLIMLVIVVNQFALWYQFLLCDMFLQGFFVMASFLAVVLTFFKYIQPKTRFFVLTILVCFASATRGMNRNVHTQILQIDTQFFIANSLFSVTFFFLSLYLYYALKKERGSLEDKIFQKQQTLQIKNINKLEKVSMAILFITAFFASSISDSIRINGLDMLYERVALYGTDAEIWYMISHAFIAISWIVWLITVKVQLNKGKMRFTYPIAAICLASVLVLFFIPDEISQMNRWMAFVGLCLMHMWYTGVMVSILGIIQLIIKPELITLALSIFISGLALGSGVAPLMTAKIIDESISDKEGYKNTCYLYFAELALIFVGLVYQYKNQKQLTNNFKLLIDQNNGRAHEGGQIGERADM